MVILSDTGLHCTISASMCEREYIYIIHLSEIRTWSAYNRQVLGSFVALNLRQYHYFIEPTNVSHTLSQCGINVRHIVTADIHQVFGPKIAHSD